MGMDVGAGVSSGVEEDVDEEGTKGHKEWESQAVEEAEGVEESADEGAIQAGVFMLTEWMEVVDGVSLGDEEVCGMGVDEFKHGVGPGGLARSATELRPRGWQRKIG
eukprot:1156900-Pelagomonas_calceolata.AAC.4